MLLSIKFNVLRIPSKVGDHRSTTQDAPIRLSEDDVYKIGILGGDAVLLLTRPRNQAWWDVQEVAPG